MKYTRLPNSSPLTIAHDDLALIEGDTLTRSRRLSFDRSPVGSVFSAALDGRIPDEGACVELGIAYGQKHLLQRDKLLIGLQTDSRGAFLGAKLNAIVQGALDIVADNEDDLMAALEAYQHRRAKMC